MHALCCFAARVLMTLTCSLCWPDAVCGGQQHRERSKLRWQSGSFADRYGRLLVSRWHACKCQCCEMLSAGHASGRTAGIYAMPCALLLVEESAAADINAY